MKHAFRICSAAFSIITLIIIGFVVDNSPIQMEKGFSWDFVIMIGAMFALVIGSCGELIPGGDESQMSFLRVMTAISFLVCAVAFVIRYEQDPFPISMGYSMAVTGIALSAGTRWIAEILSMNIKFRRSAGVPIFMC